MTPEIIQRVFDHIQIWPNWSRGERCNAPASLGEPLILRFEQEPCLEPQKMQFVEFRAVPVVHRETGAKGWEFWGECDGVKHCCARWA